MDNTNNRTFTDIENASKHIDSPVRQDVLETLEMISFSISEPLRKLSVMFSSVDSTSVIQRIVEHMQPIIDRLNELAESFMEMLHDWSLEDRMLSFSITK